MIAASSATFKHVRVVSSGKRGRLLRINPQFEGRTRELVRSDFPNLTQCDVMRVFQR